MPPIQLKRHLPTVYFDWSHICDAFHGLEIGAKQHDREMRALVVECSQRANLCLSFTHLIELLNRVDNDPDQAAIAPWLDGLDIVWMHPMSKELQLREAGAALLCHLGSSSSTFSPFVGSFSQLFGSLGVAAMSDILVCPTVSCFAEAVRTTELARSLQEDSLQNAEAFVLDQSLRWPAAIDPNTSLSCAANADELP